MFKSNKINLKKNLLKKKFIKNKVVFFLDIYSSNKFVEFLIIKLNNMFINYHFNKKNKNEFSLALFIPLENYVVLKDFLEFELKQEDLKFEFKNIYFNGNYVSVDFFESNFLIISDFYIDIFLLISFYKLICFNNITKSLFIVLCVHFNLINFLKFYLSNVNDTSSGFYKKR